LNHITAPKLLVPFSTENRSDDPLNEGEAILCVREKFAAGAPAQESTQVFHPVSFCISEIIWALLGAPPVGVGVGLGLAPGLGAGLALLATGVDDVDATLPPHPAIAIEAARLNSTRLGRSSFFSSFILGNSFPRRQIRRVAFCAVYIHPE
jgi:hypothetical protein